ncbi:hypothetical protein EFU56_18305 [Vibrio cholerae]|nr:hypothetical protein [Vibrio cholerae]OYP01343.1 hypothetical protein CI599_17980 [Vibrio cholerae]
MFVALSWLRISPNKRLKRDCQRVAFPVPMGCGGFGCCVWVWLLCVVSPLGGRYVYRRSSWSTGLVF